MIFKGFRVHTHFSSFFAQQAPQPAGSRCRALSPEREPPAPSNERVTMRSAALELPTGRWLWRMPIISPCPRHYQIDLSCVISTEASIDCQFMSSCKGRPVPRSQHYHNLVRLPAGSTRFASHIARLRRGRRLMGSSSRRLQVRSTSQGIPGALASRPPLRDLGGQDRMQLLETWWSLFVVAKI